MASAVYNIAKGAFALGDIAWDTGDIRCALLMSNTTGDTEIDANTISGITTLDECDSGGTYSRKALTTGVTVNDTSDRAELTETGGTTTWTTLAACTRQITGALIYLHVTNDSDSVPIAWVEFTSPFTPNGGDFTINWDSTGILRLA